MLIITMFLAVAVPLAFLYALHWLDLYGTDRPRIVLACVAWGLVAFLLAVIVNRFCIFYLGMPRPIVGTRTAPFVEEVFKAGILIYLVRKGKLTYFVDGAIYGFASGIGFALIENLRYMQLFPDNPLALVVVRDFSSALAHGTATAMTGMALGAYVMSGRRFRGAWPLVAGLAGAMTLHYLWNIFAFYSPLDRTTSEWILVGVGLFGVTMVAATILWGLQRERRELHETLGMKLRVSTEEANVVQHMGELDDLLAPVEARFGKEKRAGVAEFLHLEAQLGLAGQLEERTTDPGLRAERAARIAELERELDAKRSHVGVYVMLYVRSIFPVTTWSLWTRLGQMLVKLPAPRVNVWRALGERVGGSISTGGNMYARMQKELDARARAAALSMQHVHELPEAMQKYVLWVITEIHVTVDHAVVGLGHQEAHAHEMLNRLVEHGFLHRFTKDGKDAFRARPITEETRAATPHVWESVAEKIEKP